MEQQLRESQEIGEDETRAKLAFQSKVRQMEGDLASVQEQKEELEEHKEAHERQLTALQQQVGMSSN